MTRKIIDFVTNTMKSNLDPLFVVSVDIEPTGTKDLLCIQQKPHGSLDKNYLLHGPF